MTRKIIAAALVCCMAAGVLAGCSAQVGETSEKSGTLNVESSASESSEETSDKKEESKEEKSKSEEKSEEEESAESAAESAEEKSEEASEEKTEKSSEEESSKAEESSEAESSEEESSEQESSEEESDDEIPEIYQFESGFSEQDMTFVTNGGLVTLGENMADVMAKIGKASSTEKAPSCIGQGEVTSYTYDGFVIETVDSAEGEKVLDIILKDKSATTGRGISVGMSMFDITEVYGDPTESDEYFCSYKTDNGMHLDFQLEEGKIIEIDYVADLT